MLPNNSRKRRAALAAGAVFGLSALWLLSGFLYGSYGYSLLFCVIHRFTGLYCPGCGAMRAFSALMRFELYQAIRYNIFFVLALPFIITSLARLIYAYIMDGSTPKPMKWDKQIAAAISAAAILFTVARNIDAFGFLAPVQLLFI